MTVSSGPRHSTPADSGVRGPNLAVGTGSAAPGNTQALGRRPSPSRTVVLATVFVVLAAAADLVTGRAAAETPAERCARETATYNAAWESSWRATNPGNPGPPPPPPVPYVCVDPGTAPSTTTTSPPPTAPGLLPTQAPGGGVRGQAGNAPGRLPEGNGTDIVPGPNTAPPSQPPTSDGLPQRQPVEVETTTAPTTSTESSATTTAPNGQTPPAGTPAPTVHTVRDRLPVHPASRCGEDRAWSFSEGCHNLYTYKVQVHSVDPEYTPPGTAPYDSCSAASDGIVCTVTKSTTVSRTVTRTGQLGVDATIGALKASGQVSQSVADAESLTIGQSGGQAPSLPMKAGETMSAYPTYTLVHYEVQRYDAKTGQYVSTEQKQALFPDGSTYRVRPTGSPNGFPAPPPGLVPAAPSPMIPHTAGGN